LQRESIKPDKEAGISCKNLPGSRLSRDDPSKKPGEKKRETLRTKKKERNFMKLILTWMGILSCC